MKGSKHGLFSCKLAFKSVLHSKNAICLDCCYYYTALLVVTDLVAWSVSLSVTLVSPAKTAEPIEMPFALRTQIGPENHVLGGGPDPPMGRGNFEGGKVRPIVQYRDTTVICANTAEMIQMPFRLWSWMGLRNRVRWGPDLPWEGAILGERVAHCKV